jgi:hypothetical protein
MTCMCTFLPHCPAHGRTGHGLPATPQATDLLYYVTWAKRDGRKVVSLSPLPLADLEAWTAPSERVVALRLAPLATVRQ